MSAWQVERLAPGDEALYAELVARAPGTSLTHTLAWRELLAGQGLGEPVYWLARGPGESVAGLPCFLRRSERGAVLNSLPYVQSTGGVVVPGELPEAERAAAARALFEAACAWGRGEGVGVLCVVGSAFAPEPEEGAWPRAADFLRRRTVRALDLRGPADRGRFLRRMLRKAERFAPVVRVAETREQARRVHALHAETLERAGGRAHGWELLERLFAAGGRFVWAEVDGRAEAALVLLRHGELVEYYAAGSSEAGRAMQLGSWLCAHEMEVARDAGARWWSWMASPNEAVARFKERWGGEERSYAVRGWWLGDPADWLGRTAGELMEEFPGYYVAPFDLLAGERG